MFVHNAHSITLKPKYAMAVLWRGYIQALEQSGFRDVGPVSIDGVYFAIGGLDAQGNQHAFFIPEDETGFATMVHRRLLGERAPAEQLDSPRDILRHRVSIEEVASAMEQAGIPVPWDKLDVNKLLPPIR